MISSNCSCVNFFEYNQRKKQFFAARELITHEEAMGTGLLPSYPNGGNNCGGQSVFSCAYFTGGVRPYLLAMDLVLC
jgi:hypothetical protein